MTTFDANRGAPLTASQRIKEPYPHRAFYRDDYVQIKQRKPIGTFAFQKSSTNQCRLNMTRLKCTQSNLYLLCFAQFCTNICHRSYSSHGIGYGMGQQGAWRILPLNAGRETWSEPHTNQVLKGMILQTPVVT